MIHYATYNEAVNQYPNEWLLIGNPEYDGASVVGGVVLFHSKDKREVCYIGKDKTAEFAKIALVYNGNALENRKNGMLVRA